MMRLLGRWGRLGLWTAALLVAAARETGRVEGGARVLPRFDWRTASDDELMSHVERHTYRFFERFSDPSSGFACDRTSQPDVSSIAATGFALAGHAIAASQGWVAPGESARRTEQALRSLLASSGRAGRHGFFHHFLHGTTGEPSPQSEVSIIDTALLLSGVYVARAYFHENAEIQALSSRLIDAVDWPWFYDRERGLFYMAWSPEARPGYRFPDPRGGGYFCGGERTPIHWGAYTDEIALISILAAASPRHAVPAASFQAVDLTRRDYRGIRMANSYYGSLFTYLFGSCFLDTRSLGALREFNWYENSSLAIHANHRYAVEQRLPEWVFGITACEGPDGRYHNYGAPPSTVAPEFDGTIALYGIVGSVLHSRPETLKAIRELFALGLFQEDAGFADAFNPLQAGPAGRRPGVNWTRYGIDQGSILLLLENARTGFVWKQFESDPAIGAVLTSLFPQRGRLVLPPSPAAGGK